VWVLRKNTVRCASKSWAGAAREESGEGVATLVSIVFGGDDYLVLLEGNTETEK